MPPCGECKVTVPSVADTGSEEVKQEAWSHGFCAIKNSYDGS